MYEALVKKLADVGLKNSPPQEGDYLNDDGLWMCDSTTLFYLSEDLMNSDPFNYTHDEGAPYILMTAG